MKNWSQTFRDFVLKMMKDSYGSSHTQYRFNKKSNFISFEEFQDEEAINRIISLGQELKRMKDLKEKSNEELKGMIAQWQNKDNHSLVESVTVEQSNALYAKEKGIEASYELKRREDEEYYKNKVG